MATQAYQTVTPRIGLYKARVLATAMPYEVLRMSGLAEKMPKNNSDTAVFRRFAPVGQTSSTVNTWSLSPNSYETTEGVTPNAQTLSTQDITVRLQQYCVLFSYTDKVADMYEDDIPRAMTDQVGMAIGVLREQIAYGVLKAATNKFYAGGTSRATVDEAIGLSVLRRAARSLAVNYAQMVTKKLGPSPNYNTVPVSAGWVVFCHTDCEADIRDLPGFTPVEKYASGKPLSEYEIGTCERFRFIVSPQFTSYADAGAAVGATGLYSTGGSNIDVYPYLVMGQDAWGHLGLRGMDSFDFTHLKPGQKDKADPQGQRGYVGGMFYDAAVILNQGWMAVIEAGVDSLA